MAINVKALFANALLGLLEEKKLEKISINDLIQQSGASRQTFYNHFKDKNDLVQWIYMNYILINFHDAPRDILYSKHLEDYYKRIKKYRNFMRQAIAYHGQNSLRDHMATYLSSWDHRWFHDLYENKFHTTPPPEFIFFVEYHSLGSVHMILKWIEDGLPFLPEEMAQYDVTLRSYIMDYWDIGDMAPYWISDADYISNDSDYPII